MFGIRCKFLEGGVKFRGMQVSGIPRGRLAIGLGIWGRLRGGVADSVGGSGSWDFELL